MIHFPGWQTIMSVFSATSGGPAHLFSLLGGNTEHIWVTPFSLLLVMDFD